MIYIIDGTGEEEWTKYYPDMRRGFCMNIERQNSDTDYMRGPTLFGTETWRIGDIIYEDIKRDLKKDPSITIILVGHSRGGASCIYVAQKLQTDGIPVKAMILFDAVRRVTKRSLTEYGIDVLNATSPPEMVYKAIKAAVELSMDTLQIHQKIDVIPGNVKRALHFVRDEKFSNYFINTQEYKNLISESNSSSLSPSLFSNTHSGKRLILLEQFHKRMRDACRFNCFITGTEFPSGFSFGNTGLKSEPGCELIIKPYMATHGAMGGAPLEVQKYISDQRYAEEIESQEVTSMIGIQTEFNCFFREIGLFDSKVKLDYVPASLPNNRSQTAIK